MSYYFLSHSRTPGSKNGVRLYQNEDGTWTPLGLERRRSEYKSQQASKGARIGKAVVGVAGGAGAVGGIATSSVYAFNKKNVGRAFTPGKDNKPSPMEKATRAAGDSVNETKKLMELFDPTDKRPYTNDLSNKELEQMIRRMDLEKRYSELSKGSQEKGRDWVNTSIAAVGGLAALAGSAAAIITAINKIRGKE